MKYNPAEIEPKWQSVWDDKKVYRTSQDLEQLRTKPKFYVLDMFPYPSGTGLHVGHGEGYTGTDVVARFKRMTGHNVLHPMGWDAFGLPAERAAVRENVHPAKITQQNVDYFRQQIQRLGFSYDWDREFATSDPDYYRWTQWIFLRLFERDLAYLADVPVNWCPALGTVLANEEVKDGVYIETGDPVERRNMRQWMLKITEYAERLLQDLELVDWPESVKEMQRNWIGKSEGADIVFDIAGDAARSGHSFTVFTTRPDTLFGATYCVLAPEHPLVGLIATEERRAAVEAYVEAAKQKTDLVRTDLAKEKTGVFTGAAAVHPVTGDEVPIWVADYVLMSYGTGAIMAVPGQDQRDWDFAEEYGLPIVRTVQPEDGFDGKAYVGEGPAINSGFLDGLGIAGAKRKMIDWLEEHGKGSARVQYKLRDWLFSRQRYWGEPFPIVLLDDGSAVPIPESNLPVTLPHVDEYRPTPDGRPPLARGGDDWLMVELPDGRKGVRETNTMPQWAGSCWYYLRYIDPHNEEQPWDPELEKYWLPVDLYVGGVEHAVLHLLYARFWHKVLYDCGMVASKEPFQRLFNQGMILATSYCDAQGKYHFREDLEKRGNQFFVPGDESPVSVQVEKMAKSKLNGVDPMQVIAEYGADAVRLYELFMGPFEATKPWQMEGVEGIYRFLGRAWRLVVDERTGELAEKVVDDGPEHHPELRKALHQTIAKVHDDTEGLRFNTAISQMMVFVNEATAADAVPRQILQTFVRVLSPYAPHLAEELWQRLGADSAGLVVEQPWPEHDAQIAAEETITVVVQVNGKLRDRLEVAPGTARDELEQRALASEAAQRFLEGATPRKVIVVPDRLVNIVI
ncbi:MAG: leucine--tRNA ligase [Thermoanaerobaculia bacterium]|nr:leucine--tRNA ligase [Thermoanaerobaculia bacterium]